MLPSLAVQAETWAAVAPAVGRPARDVRAACRQLVERLGASLDDAVLVFGGVDPQRLVSCLRLPGGHRTGVLDPNHGASGLDGYGPVAGSEPPEAAVYALVGLERGDEYRGVAPREALNDLERRGRTPLTIDEGLAAVLVSPALLARNHCFSLAGSRRGDRRVLALWISAGAPRLGWCWEGNPHGWLGLASARERIA